VDQLLVRYVRVTVVADQLVHRLELHVLQVERCRRAFHVEVLDTGRMSTQQQHVAMQYTNNKEVYGQVAAATYRLSEKRSISAGEMYWTICVEWADDIMILV